MGTRAAKASTTMSLGKTTSLTAILSFCVLQNEPGHHPGDDAGLEEDPVRQPRCSARRAASVRLFEPDHTGYLPVCTWEDQQEERCVLSLFS